MTRASTFHTKTIMTSQRAMFGVRAAAKSFLISTKRRAAFSFFRKAPSMFVYRSRVDTEKFDFVRSGSYEIQTLKTDYGYSLPSARDYLLPSLLLFITALNPL